jgi:hypothetical protein
MKKLTLRILFLGLCITSIVACSSGGKTQTKTPNLNNPPATSVAKVADSTDKIKFKTEGGSDLFALKQQTDGAKLVDGNNQELARIKIDKPGKTKIKNATEKVLGYVLTEKGSWKLENPEQNKALYILKRQSNDDYKLLDSANKEIYHILAGNNGWKIETPDKKLVYEVKVKEGKISLKNPSATTIFSTKSGISPIAFACFGFDVLTREQQAGLAYVVNLTGGQ